MWWCSLKPPGYVKKPSCAYKWTDIWSTLSWIPLWGWRRGLEEHSRTIRRGEKRLIPQRGWPLSCNLWSSRPSWKPEQQLKLWTGQVCDLSGVLARVFSSGLENKSYILGARPSVALTKEEPNTQKTFIYRRNPFYSSAFSPHRKWDESWSGDMRNWGFAGLDVSARKGFTPDFESDLWSIDMTYNTNIGLVMSCWKQSSKCSSYFEL